MNIEFHNLLQSGDNTAAARFIRTTIGRSGQLDSDDIMEALVCLFEQVEAIKQMAEQAQFAR